MRVLIASHRFFISGGPETYMFRVMDLLRQAGNEAIPFSLAYSRNEPTPYSRLFPRPPQGAEAVFYEQIQAGPIARLRIAAASIYSRSIRRLAREAMESERIDAVYGLALGNWLYPEVVLAASDLGIPVVWRLSDFQLLCPRYDLLRDSAPCELCLDSLFNAVRYRCVKGSIVLSGLRAVAMSAHRAARVLDRLAALAFPSRFTLERHLAFGIPREKLRFLPPLAPWIDEKRRPDPEHLLFVGNVLPHKGLDIARRALDLLGRQMPLVVAGADLSGGLPASADVRHVGFVGGEELDDLYRRALAVLVPSLWYENAPNVVLEAMAHAVPVVASDIGSLPELVIDGVTGLLAPPGDVEAWADRISRLANDPGLAARMGEAARERARAEFSAPRHLDVLEDLLRPRSSRV